MGSQAEIDQTAQRIVDLNPEEIETFEAIIDGCGPEMIEALLLALKSMADKALHADSQLSWQTAVWMERLAVETGIPTHKAIALLAKANASGIGLGHHEPAIDLYNEAAHIYQLANDETQFARAQIGKLASLATLGRYQEALQSADSAVQRLEHAGEWELLAKTLKNIGAIHGRMGDDQAALDYLQQALNIWQRLENPSRGFQAGLQINRAYVLTNLGQFDEALQASTQAIKLLQGSDEKVRVARAKQGMAVTYYLIGRYNEALIKLEQAEADFREDDRLWDAAVATLFASECKMLIGDVEAAIDDCRRARRLFQAANTPLEQAQTLLVEAGAQAKRNEFEKSLELIASARTLFQAEGNRPFEALTYLEAAKAYALQGNFLASKEAAERAISMFEASGTEYYLSLAHLASAKARLDLGDYEAAESISKSTLTRINPEIDVRPALQAHQILAQVYAAEGNFESAEMHFQSCLGQVERLRSHIMIEQRPMYIDDKEDIYQQLVSLYIKTGNSQQAFQTAERAKSRSLLDLIKHRVNLKLEAKEPADQSLADELSELRTRRDQKLRRWLNDVQGVPDIENFEEGGAAEVAKEIKLLEDEIERVWHQLLRHNADYASEASIWRVQQQFNLPKVDPEVVLLEFFDVGSHYLVFACRNDEIKTYQLEVTKSQLTRQINFLFLNLFLSAQAMVKQDSGVESQLQQLLAQFYRQLIEPVEAVLERAERLLIIPHGPLHYLPFQALYAGEGYLVERFEISYLPSAQFSLHFRTEPANSMSAFCVGYSHHGSLPHTILEANEVAEILGGEVALESQATRTAIAQASDRTIIHIASHGQFRGDNPLFSGVLLEDGWLTSFDVFNMNFSASLITLSACQTGRNAISGGDELVGLTRAFTYAGARSLLLSLWPIQDDRTATFMQLFYRALTNGHSKSGALRSAQLAFIRSDDTAARNPYFWAPFNLFGDHDKLVEPTVKRRDNSM